MKQRAAIVGAGPAGLIAAEVLAASGVSVTVFDHTRSAGRKLLLAGRSGLNLTHGEPLTELLKRYTPHDARIAAAIEAFPPAALRDWCHGLGQSTFVGSSGRVFPESMRATPLLRSWLARLSAAGVELVTEHRWTGWNARGELMFSANANANANANRNTTANTGIPFDATVLALGGASWPGTGSDGGWVATLERSGVSVDPLRPANCGMEVAWSDVLRTRFEGVPIKNVALRFGDQSVRGDVVITATGLEGGPVYTLASAIARPGSESRNLLVDLRPDLSAAQLTLRLERDRQGATATTHLRKAAGLSPAAIAVLREALVINRLTAMLDEPEPLARYVKAVPIAVTGVRPMTRAISSSGGVALSQIDDHFMLRPLPGVFVAGEMLAWDAPTGGYLLQGCFSTGVCAARGVLNWLRERSPGTASGTAPSLDRLPRP